MLAFDDDAMDLDPIAVSTAPIVLAAPATFESSNEVPAVPART